MSPEYALCGHFSVKSDVFSFGVLVLEIISGKRNWRFCHPDHDLNLIGHVSIKIYNVGNFSSWQTQFSIFWTLFHEYDIKLENFRHGNCGVKRILWS